jgi:hypothetical protein
MVVSFEDGDAQVGRLYGEAQMTYGKAKLTGPTIEMQIPDAQLQATSPNGSSQRPIFERGDGDAFTGAKLQYNLRTRRGRVVGARRVLGEGYVEGEVVKSYEDSTVFLQSGEYTTCNCPPDETPSYSLRAQRMKIGQDQWIYTGPIQLFLYNVPTPLWLPFGFLPSMQRRHGGFIPPQWGERNELGFYLKDWGWYFAFNDYMDLQLTGGIYTSGSFELTPLFRYNKRYSYSGDVDLLYRRSRRGESGDPDFAIQNELRLRWNHSQDINPTSDFSADVDLSTSSTTYQLDSEDYDDRVRPTIGSTVNYSKRWDGGGSSRRFRVNLSQNQNLLDGSADLTLPSVDFSQSSFQPFSLGGRRAGAGGGDRTWFERISTQYSLSVDNRYRFNPRDPEELRERGTARDSVLADSIEAADIQWYEALVDRRKYRLATGDNVPFDFEAQHRIPLSTRFSIDRFGINISPSVRYNSTWLLRTQRKGVERQDGEEQVVTRTVDDFHIEHDLSTSLSANTTVYGTFPLQVGAFRGLRHTVRPSISATYRPDFNDPFWGQTRTYRDTSGALQRYNIVTGNDVRGSREQQSLSFSLGNAFETKYVQTDSTGEEQEETIKLLDVDLSSGYNFAADSLELGDFSLRVRSDDVFRRLSQQSEYIRNLSVQFQSTLSPYAVGPEGQLVDRYYLIESGGIPARVTNLSVNAGIDLESQGGFARGGGQQQQGAPGTTGAGNPPPGTLGSAPSGQGQNANQQAPTGQPSGPPPNPDSWAGYSIPWSLGFDFRYGFNRRGTQTRRSASLNADVRFSPTPLWQVSGRTGYDFIQQEVVPTKISISRDLGCWRMSLDWWPVGNRLQQSFGFNLQVKTGRLSQILQLNIPRSDPTGRFRNTVSGAVSGGGGGGGGVGFR